MKRSISVVLAATVITLTTSGALAADTAPATAPAGDTPYKIKLERPSAKGDTYDVHHELTVNETDNITFPDEPPETENHAIKADLQATCVVKEVDERGREIAVALTIRKFTTGDNNVEIPAGKVIEIKCGEKETKITVPEGFSLSDDAEELLKMMYEPDPQSDLTDDDMIDTKVPHKVGEHWPVNPEPMAKMAKLHGMETDAKQISGSTVIKGMERVNGGDALRVVTDVTITGVKPDDLPPEMAVQKSESKQHTETVLPIDEKQQASEVTQTQDEDFTCLVPSQPGITQVIHTHIVEHMTISPAAK